jgi:hypothetical protein
MAVRECFIARAVGGDGGRGWRNVSGNDGVVAIVGSCPGSSPLQVEARRLMRLQMGDLAEFAAKHEELGECRAFGPDPS